MMRSGGRAFDDNESSLQLTSRLSASTCGLRPLLLSSLAFSISSSSLKSRTTPCTIIKRASRLISPAPHLISNYQNISYPRYLPPRQSSNVGKTRTVCASETSSSSSELSRSSFGNSTSTFGLAPEQEVYKRHNSASMASDYSARLQATEQIRPHTPSPGTGTARSNLAKTNLRAYSSKMVSHSVNKTALHPGGVE